MRQDLNEISNGKYDSSASLTVIKGIIHRHQRIITLSGNIESLFCYIALMQLLWNTLVICCNGFVIVIVSNGGLLLHIFDEEYLFLVLLQTIRADEGATTLIKSISFYSAITLEVFILCFAGEFLSAKVCKRVCRVYPEHWLRLFIFLLCFKRKKIFHKK